MRYMLSVEVKLQEIPEDEPEQETEQPVVKVDLENSLQTMVANAGKLLNPIRAFFPPVQPAGLDFRKQVAVSASTFQGLAQIIMEFENLTRQIQLERAA